jgi:hypothetical protein
MTSAPPFPVPGKQTCQHLEIFFRLKEGLRSRFITSRWSAKEIIIKYQTKGGYYLRAHYSNCGCLVRKEYYRHYDEGSQTLYDYLFTRNIE